MKSSSTADGRGLRERGQRSHRNRSLELGDGIRHRLLKFIALKFCNKMHMEKENEAGGLREKDHMSQRIFPSASVQ